MANVHDVAAAILKRTGTVSAMKLQKLVYYCEAWHAVWDDEILFGESIEAWANGPVCRALYNEHRGDFVVSTWPMGKSHRLKPNEIASVDAVLLGYGKMSAHELSALTHREDPWVQARHGLAAGERGSRQISVDSMVTYYGSLDTSDAVDLD